MSDEPLRRLSTGPLAPLSANLKPEDYWPGLREQEPPEDIRVVLVKPGDQLIIGNVGLLTEEFCEAIADTFRRLGFDRPVILFTHDITMDALHGQDVEA